MQLVTRLLIFCLLWQIAPLLYAFHSNETHISFLDQSLQQVREIAKEEEKFIFVDIYAEWCGPCKKMEQKVFTDPKVAKLFNQNFLSIRLDADNDPLKSLEAYNVTVLPTFLFFDPKGRMVYKREGYTSGEKMIEIAKSLTSLQVYHEAYTRKPDIVDNVWNYSNALAAIENDRAYSVALGYLKDLKEKKYSDSLNWQLIKEYVKPWHTDIFDDVLSQPVLLEAYPIEYVDYIYEGLNELLEFGINQDNSSYLRQYTGYVRKLSFLLSNPDSLVAAAEVRYYAANKPDELNNKIEKYIENFEEQTAKNLAGWSRDIANTYFQKELLLLAEKYGLKSNSIQPNYDAFLSLAMTYDKLMDFKKAYAYLLLSYEYADTKGQEELLANYKNELDFKLQTEFENGVNFAGKDSRGDDGRFTLGAGSERLMYGYPVPKSTSHFIINIDGKLASNAPHLAASGVKYLSGVNQYTGKGSTPTVFTVFKFEDAQITQKLIPVDENGVEIESGFAQYYRVSYEVSNLTDLPKKIGVGVLFDTMIDDNDDCRITADGIPVLSEYGFLKKGMPSELLFYKTENDTSDTMGAAILKGMGATPPDKLVIGRWPVLHGVSWVLNPQKVKYGDSAYFIKWENRKLSARSSLGFTTYYGLPKHKKPILSILLEDDEYLVKKENIYFSNQHYGLDLNARMIIDEIASDESIRVIGVLLNGYTDVKGGKNYNFTLSSRRIESVANVLSAYGIPHIPKPHGFSASSSSALDEMYGNAWDRKVEIEIYYKKKNDLGSLMSAQESR